MIKVYPSVLEGEPLELHETYKTMTMRQWLTANAPDFDFTDPPINIEINGQQSGLDCEFSPSDIVEVRIVPRGLLAAIIIAVVIVAATVAVSMLMSRKVPKPNSVKDQLKGKPLDSASLSGNTARYGDPIPEIAGSPPRIYPDMLLPTRTYYSAPQVQWVEGLFCIGKGEYVKLFSDVYIGDTRAATLGGNVEVAFYEPGADLSNESAADWWHMPDEVGLTSRGNAGLELGTTTTITKSATAGNFSVSGNILTAGEGTFPSDWNSGTNLRIVVPYQATVTAGVAGSTSMITGSNTPARLDFGITPSVFVIDFNGNTYTVNLTANVASTAMLANWINNQLAMTPLAATVIDNKIVIFERNTPYSGKAITVYGDGVIDVFGNNPIITTGVKTQLGDVIKSAHAFKHFVPMVGMEVELIGIHTGISGIYKIHTFKASDDYIPWTYGTQSSYAASDTPARLTFSGNPIDIDIDFDGSQYNIYIDQDYNTVTQLATDIMYQLLNVDTKLDVILNPIGTTITIVERWSSQSIYSGKPILVSGDVAVVFGSNPVSVTGIKTIIGQDATDDEVTLETLDGIIVTNLPKGTGYLAAGRPGMTYTITERLYVNALKLADADWYGAGVEIQVSLASSSTQTGWVGWFNATPPNEKCTTIELDFEYPNGLIQYNDAGDPLSMSRDIIVQVTGTGMNDISQHYFISATDANAIGYTKVITLGAQASNVQVRVSTPKPASDSSRISDKVFWTGLRAKMVGAPTKYDGVTTMAIKMRTGDKISSQVNNKVWLKATRILPLMEGGTGATRDIAPFLLHVLKTCGYDSRIDMGTLQDLHEIWQARGDRFDLSIDKHSTIKRVANDILAAGFAELTINRGLLTPVRDALRNTVNYIYSPQELIEYPIVTTKMIEPDEIDGVDAEYIDEFTGKTEVVKYRLSGDAGKRAEKIQLPGVTNKTKAWRLAARHRRAMAYRRTTFKGTTELHALNSSYMSLDRIQDGIPEYGQSCFVTSVEGLKIGVSEPLDFASDATRVIALRHKDGRVTNYVTVKPGANDYEIELLSPLPFPFEWSFGGIDNIDPTMLYFGKLGYVAHDVLITLIEPKSDNTVDIQAVVYDERVYADDNRSPA